MDYNELRAESSRRRLLHDYDVPNAIMPTREAKCAMGRVVGGKVVYAGGMPNRRDKVEQWLPH